jgi:putative chitinase
MSSENGWEPSHAGPDILEWIVVPGTNVHLQVMKGWPSAVMKAYAADYNAFVEPLRDADSASFTPTNSVATSNHLNGTAMDLNWNSHPFRVANAGYNPQMIATMREILDFYEDTMFWAQDWNTPKDAMHHQMGYDTWNNPRVRDFIARKIRADGFSTFRRGTVPPPPPPPVPANNAADVLARATGLDLSRATTILPTVVSGLQASQCNNVKRVAMWLAQCGEESAGFSTTEEFASGAEYEGRCSDLGNCSPGDGVKYKGRTWIQITGKAHYAEFSKWAYGKNLITSATQFVDNPASLGDLKWAGIGAAWYWTVSRPDINALSDNGDVVTVTHRINGGEHGLADRQNRYSRAHALGDQLLTLTSPTTQPSGDDMANVPQDQWDRVYRELTQKLPSRSPLRHLGEGPVDTMAGFVLNTDGSEHVEICKVLAEVGHQPTLDLLNEVGAADPSQYPDRQADAALARNILKAAKKSWAAPTVAKAAAEASGPSANEIEAGYRIQALQAENESLRARLAVAESAASQAQTVTPASTAVAVPEAKTTGAHVASVVDSVENWTDAALAMDVKQRASLTTSIKVLESMKNGSQP